MTERRVFQGIGVSAGVAVGPIALVGSPVGIDEHEPASSDPAADLERIRQALAEVAHSYTERATHANSPTSSEILEATAAIATDRGLIKQVSKELTGGAGVTHALHNAVEVYAERFRKVGGYTAERVTDLYDVRDRTTAHLRNLPEPGIPELTEPSILVAHDLVPAETATLDPAMVLGIVTEGGGPTSHTAILAGQLGIPAVIQAKGILGAADGRTRLAIDGASGEVMLQPTEGDVAGLKGRAPHNEDVTISEAVRERLRNGDIKLLVNIGSVEEARRAATLDVDGCGLFRTEFLYLNRNTAPTVEEQTDTYISVLRAFGDRRVVVRVLDAGSDKPLPFVDLGPEMNPALGRRGIRLLRVREDLLDDQLEALANAHEAVTGCDLWVMAPMITTVEETQWFVHKARKHGLPRAGVMIETPAAAIMAEEILEIADFASIGTNDLVQYTMAADRMQGELADLLSPQHPAITRLVRTVAEAGLQTGKPIGICGEAAGDPGFSLPTLEWGISSLSMAPAKADALRAIAGGQLRDQGGGW